MRHVARLIGPAVNKVVTAVLRVSVVPEGVILTALYRDAALYVDPYYSSTIRNTFSYCHTRVPGLS